MQYNTSRSKMLMPEYGRNVQRMVEYLLTIEDRAKRLKNAEAIIELMGTLNPHLKTIEDYKHKLWDHLHQMTDFRLDVDAPYPAPTPEQLFKKPEPIPYPKSNINYRHLGHNLESLLKKAMAEKDPAKRQGYTQTIGYYMKLAYTNWHKEPIHDDMIRNELNELTNGFLQYETGGYRVHFDNRQGFKRGQGGQQGGQGQSRHFKGGQGRGGQQNRSFGQGGNREGGTRDGGPHREGGSHREGGPHREGGSYGGGFKPKHKFNKNKNK